MRALQYQSSRSLLSSAQWPTTCGITMQARVEWLQCLSQPRVNIWTQVLVRPVLGLPVLLHHQWLASHKPEASWYHLVSRRWGWHLPIIPNPDSFQHVSAHPSQLLWPVHLLISFVQPLAPSIRQDTYWILEALKGDPRIGRGFPNSSAVSCQEFQRGSGFQSLEITLCSDSFGLCAETNMMFDDTPGMGRPRGTSQSWRLPKRIRSHHFGMISLTNRFRSISVPSGNLT